MRIHAIQTGTVRVHERQRTGRGRGVLRFANTLLDGEWTEPLPIYAFLIEHQEGPILIDTGETARTAEPGYFPRWHPYFRLALKEDVAPTQEVGARLESIGIRRTDIRRVVLTHLHTDHAGGLHHFAGSEILVSRVEHAVAAGVRGRVRGYLPHRWPEWFEPTLIDFQPERFGPFSMSRPITRSGDVRLVPTPGHTAGHLSVVVDEGERLLFFAGDMSYTEANLLTGVADGVSSLGGGEVAARRTLERVRALARQRPLVYLPSHDPATAERLASRRVVRVDPAPDRAAA